VALVLEMDEVGFAGEIAVSRLLGWIRLMR